ncbi:MAG: hypothetical protein ABI551_20425, partial [Polyangiaceae bacterium]
MRARSRRFSATFLGAAVVFGVATSSLAQTSSTGAKPAASASASAASAKPTSSGSAASASAAPSASAASTASAGPQAASSPGVGGIATARKTFPPPPPPTPQQVAALTALQQETDAYAQGAKDYRDTITTIVKLHYEEKKQEILSGLDSEIAIEKTELQKAREIAIQRLEEFIQKYSGPTAQPEATPDAMYRLAALYEERARGEDATDDVSAGLKPAIALYKRVINEFPKYKQLAAIYY